MSTAMTNWLYVLLMSLSGQDDASGCEHAQAKQTELGGAESVTVHHLQAADVTFRRVIQPLKLESGPHRRFILTEIDTHVLR